MKKILIFLGNPDTQSYSGTLADAYEAGARKAGHEVERVNIGEMKFDPVLHLGYREIQQLEPDLLMMQDKIKWADHVVFIYPNWWCTMPAKLKGFFDRAWLPGFAFNFDKKTKKCIRHFKGKTARVVVIAGTHSPFLTWWKFGDYTNEISDAILRFAGFRVRVSAFGPSERVSTYTRDRWKEKMQTMGERGS